MIQSNWLSFWFVLGVVTSLSLAFCQTKINAQTVCNEKDNELCSTSLAKGEKAPYNGQLLTTKLAIQLGQKAEKSERLLQIELEKERTIAKLNLELEKKLRAIEKESYEKQLKKMQENLEKSCTRPLYREPWFVAIVTGVLVGGGFIAAIKGAQMLQK